MERYFTIEKLMPCCGEASRCKYCHQATAEAHSEQPRIIANLNALGDHVLEPLHEAFKGDIKVLDGYRCAGKNRKEIWSREKGSDTYWQVSKLILAKENENQNQ